MSTKQFAVNINDSLSRRRDKSTKIATSGDLANDELRGDDIAAWERRSKPIIALLATPKTMSEVRDWGRHCRAKERDHYPFGANLAEEAVYWLEMRGVIYRDHERRWRLK